MRRNAMTASATPQIVDRDEWERLRADLLAREKAHTRAGDALAAARRRLPMMRACQSPWTMRLACCAQVRA